MIKEQLKTIDKFNIEDGATAVYYTDRKAFTILSITEKEIIVQEDTARIDPSYKPNIIAGGFAGHCLNNNEQKWICTPNKDGYIESFTKRKNGKWVRKGSNMSNGTYLVAGKHHFHDYNF
jgi:hypothetical protein